MATRPRRSSLTLQIVRRLSRYTFPLRQDLGLAAHQNVSVKRARELLIGTATRPRRGLGERAARWREAQGLAEAPLYDCDVVLIGDWEAPESRRRARALLELLDAAGVSTLVATADRPADELDIGIERTVPHRHIGAHRLCISLGRFAETKSIARHALQVFWPDDILATKDLVRAKLKADIVLLPVGHEFAADKKTAPFGGARIVTANWSHSAELQHPELKQTLDGILALCGLPHPESTNDGATAAFAKFAKPVQLIDVYMTTSRRPNMLKRTLPALLEACRRSAYDHRITVLADCPDEETAAILYSYQDRIHLISTPERLGLPFMWNLVLDHNAALAARSERRPDYVCYIQDDCLINHPDRYFSTLVDCHRNVLDPYRVGYVSGFYCPIHPGFERRHLSGSTVLLSDSIDGKNFMATPQLLRQVGKLSWYFEDGERRGNPGPSRGSHFDLWQWKESPTSLTKLGKISLIIPGLCSHIAQSAEDSTWGNSTLPEHQQRRVSEGRIYKTRQAVVPPVAEADFFVTGRQVRGPHLPEKDTHEHSPEH